jgi:hypothetical protein
MDRNPYFLNMCHYQYHQTCFDPVYPETNSDPITELFDKFGPMTWRQFMEFPGITVEEKETINSKLDNDKKSQFQFKFISYMNNIEKTVHWTKLCDLRQKWPLTKYKLTDMQVEGDIVELHFKYLCAIFRINQLDHELFCTFIYRAMEQLLKMRCLWMWGCSNTAKSTIALSLRNFLVSVEKMSTGSKSFVFSRATKCQVAWLEEMDAESIPKESISTFKSLCEGGNPIINPKYEYQSTATVRMVMIDSNHSVDEILDAWERKRYQCDLHSIRGRILPFHFKESFEFDNPNTMPFTQGFHPFAMRKFILQFNNPQRELPRTNIPVKWILKEDGSFEHKSQQKILTQVQPTELNNAPVTVNLY